MCRRAAVAVAACPDARTPVAPCRPDPLTRAARGRVLRLGRRRQQRLDEADHAVVRGRAVRGHELGAHQPIRPRHRPGAGRGHRRVHRRLDVGLERLQHLPRADRARRPEARGDRRDRRDADGVHRRSDGRGAGVPRARSRRSARTRSTATGSRCATSAASRSSCTARAVSPTSSATGRRPPSTPATRSSRSRSEPP